jgi:endo-1,4-beta-xylanase
MQTSPSLAELARSRGVEFGCAINVRALRDSAAYRDAILRECGVLVAENASKFEPLSPRPFEWDYTDFDEIVAFAEANGMKMRGHALLWHNQAPAWVTQGEWKGDEAKQLFSRHIHQTVGRYRGRIESWDVVNEAIEDDGSMRATFWGRMLGEDAISWALHLAHEADPAVQLVYNDYSVEEENPKSDRMASLAEDLLKSGAPLHGLGLQGHLELERPPAMDSVRRNLRRLRGLGLELLITELDVRIQEPFTEEKRRLQAEIYEDFLTVCLEEGVSRILTWGLSDRWSWVPGFFTGTGEALLLDQEYLPKPAREGVARALRGS